MTTIRANVYESDPLLTFIERVSPESWTDYYDLPEELVVAFEAAEKQITAAREAIEEYIRVNRLTRQTQEGVSY